MNSFTITLLSANESEEIPGIVSFVGEDSSGSFGILSGHARIMTSLQYGLCKFQNKNSKVEYLALPGGLLYFLDNTLFICTRHYIRNPDYKVLLDALDNQLRIEEENLRSMKESLHQLDTEMLKHLWELKRKYGYGTE